MHLYILKLKTIIRDRPLIFWTLLFPLALALIFNFVFQNIKNTDDFETIKVGYVVSNFGDNEKLLTHAMSEVKYEGRDVDLFLLTEESEQSGLAKLETEEITALIDFQNNHFVFYTKKTSIYATITKSFIDEFIQANGLINEMITLSKGELTPEEAFTKYMNQANFVKKYGNQEIDLINVYFYSVVAMTLMFGSILGLKEAVLLQPNYLPASKRIAMSRFSKPKLFITSIAVTFTVQLAQMIIFLLFILLILKVPIFNLPLTLLLIFIGMVMSASLGYALAFIFKKVSYSSKIGILTAVTMLGSFLAGMMAAIVKYYVARYVPPLAYINPTNLISDSLYKLSLGNTRGYWINIIAMVGIIAIFIIVASISYWRDDYESI